MRTEVKPQTYLPILGVVPLRVWWLCHPPLFAKQRVQRLFRCDILTKTNRSMRTELVMGAGAKQSNTAQVWRGQAIIFGWLKINKTFTNKADAVAWYNRYQQGWRYRNAVAVVWQGCTAKTAHAFLKDAMLGGDEWRLAMCRHIKSQAACDYILYCDDYEYATR